MATLGIKNDIYFLEMLQTFVIQSAKIYKLPKEIFDKLRLTTEEAFVYILKNSFEEGEIADIEVRTDLDSTNFIVSFFDKGLPFDGSLAKQYHSNQKLDNFDIEGIELFLIKKFTHKILWINHGFEGKEFRLVFEIPTQDIATLLEDKKQIFKDDDKINEEDIEIREFKKSDALLISRIIYRSYGYTYPNEDMYYPQKIVKLNESGELISIVCYDKKTKEVVGHYALERPNLGSIAESGQAVVSPRCRGFGLMKKMRVLIEEKARTLKLEGIMSQPVTTHTFSQQVNEGFGSSPCGFSFGLVPQKLSFKQINSKLSQRESCFLYYKSLNKTKREIFVPKKYQDIVSQIYKSLNLPFEINSKKSTGDGIVKSNFASGWGIGVIDIKEIGKNSIKEFKDAFYNLLFVLKADVIFLNITLQDSSFDDLLKTIEKEKFFFAGVVPSLLDGKDVIRFEFLNGVIDESKIKIGSTDARTLFEYISKEKSRIMS